MFYLLGSIILSSYLTLAFKVCERYQVNIFQAIVFALAAFQQYLKVILNLCVVLFLF